LAILVWISALALVVGGESIVVRDGRPVTATGQDSGWRTVDGWLEAQGKEAKLKAGVGLGPGDFEIRARVEIRHLAKSACAFLIRDSYFGFEGGHGKVFLTGPVFGDAHGTPIGDPKEFLNDGVPFDFSVVRTGTKLRIAIDGKMVWQQEVGSDPLGSFGFLPWRATMRIQSCVVKGNVAERFLKWKPPVRISEERGMRKIVLLPPGPENPRNSEGDFIQLRDGRVLFVYTHFTGGRSDHAKAYLAGRFSSDGGATWTDEDTVILPNEGDWNIMSVSILRLQDGRIALFYMRKNSLEDCRPLVRFSTDEAKTWSEPNEVIPDSDMGYYVLNNDRAVQLKGGRLILPVALHNRPGWKDPDWAGEIACFLSDDAGQTWRCSKTRQKAYSPDKKRVVAQEPGVVELKDGRVMMFIRTNAGVQYLSFSADGGDSWSPMVPSNIPSPQSPASIERIPSTGDLLLVWNNHADVPKERAGLRTPYNAAISRDEGKTWQNVHTIEDDPDGWYCYTAVEIVGDHVLLGHCSGKRSQALATTQITRFPLKWLYEAE
jgi:hypothetical protein